LSQVLNRGAQAVARSAAPCAAQVRDRGTLDVARSAATLPQQEKSNSADVQRRRVNITTVSEQWRCSSRGDVSSMSSSPWPLLRGGDGVYFNSFHAACACSKTPRRGPPAALPGAGVLRSAWGNGAFLIFLSVLRIPLATYQPHHTKFF
jgi:hypothetical protein